MPKVNVIKKVKASLRGFLRKHLNVESASEHYFIKNFNKSSIIVDIGSGRGQFINMMVEMYPYSQFILIEPNPDSAKVLSQEFKTNTNVKILAAAVGARSEKSVSFYLSETFQFDSLDKSLSDLGGVRKDRSEVTVRMITLRDVFSIFNLQKIDFLKIDAEGAELDILENFSSYDFEMISQISCEFHDFLKPSLRKEVEECIHNLQSLGYSFVCDGTDFMFGSPYFNCLFYDKKRIKWSIAPRWLSANYLQYLTKKAGIA
ncbi:MAG: FkbM family methyltransferase [Candidatus Omnitrophica bacterium]|nr:FkbM family methyltransferase [Candidatus Omnitrophota bacterium]